VTEAQLHHANGHDHQVEDRSIARTISRVAVEASIQCCAGASETNFTATSEMFGGRRLARHGIDEDRGNR
jgi:hypothetical protein